MQDPTTLLAMSGAALAAVIVLSLAGLKAWHDWIALQQLKLQHPADAAPVPTMAARIELADLRERIRKLEAIAAGVDY